MFRTPRNLLAVALASLSLVVAVSACQSAPAPATPSTAPGTAQPANSPSAQTAALPSPSPGLPLPSPSALAAPSPSPTAALVAGGVLRLDDHPFAVMIDNIKAARPQFGLGDADVVYEAPAESGIPRLMPVYLRAGVNVGSIGPVRSARHYFVYIANEYRVPLVHIGASPQGFDALAATGLPDVDEQRGDDGFIRVPDREAPHNAFVTTTSIRDVLRQHGVQIKSAAGPLNFGDYTAGPQPATTIKIPYPGPEHYSVQYDYAPDQQRYMRIMDGAPHDDGTTGDQYGATSIIIQYTDVEPIPNDDAFRVDVGLVGSGKGILIAGGTQVPLQWSRASVRDATHFTRTDGVPFALPQGQVWIQIVPLETRVSIT